MEIVKSEQSKTCDRCGIADFKWIDFGTGGKLLCLSCLYTLLKDALGEMI